MIPELGPTGHLPPGRYLATVAEVEARFVAHPQFRASSTRQGLFEGVQRYLTTWAKIELSVGRSILVSMWIAGSFASAEVNPSDIDVSPMLDEAAVKAARGQGSKQIKKLIQHRASVVTSYGVEPYPIVWRSVASSLHVNVLQETDKVYFAKRGSLDDWWQRVRPPGPKAPPRAPTTQAERGYLEVTL